MMPNSSEIVILSAVRTPIGKFLGALAKIHVAQLGAIVIKAAIQQAGIHDNDIDEVILGSVLTAGAGQNIARQAAMHAGLPERTPAHTVNMVCGSGLMSIIHAARAILAGDADFIVAGGAENMSAAPFLLPRVREGQKMGHLQLVDSLLKDGLTDSFNDIHMGLIAENIAGQYGISRREQDAFAQRSQEKAKAAIKQDRFIDEIVPVVIQQHKETIPFDQDEFPRFDSNLEGLANLKPSFKPTGTVTAGNASGINDGAAALVIARRSRAIEMGLTPMAGVLSWGTAGVDPAFMGLGPIPATQKALARAKLSMQDIDLVESNEAFAAQCLAVSRELNIPEDRLNVNGGAIALGHPIGASGARITVSLAHEMQKRRSGLGLATLCIGGGMGAALVLAHPDP